MPSAPSIDSRNVNSLWSSVLVETLVRSGVQQVVISPGSRSTALTMAAVRSTELECIPVLDERSAGFFALGLARQKLSPVALICTSGTAAANYLPAIIEARESAVPLIVLTADRPPELRACASGQTIDQLKLYGDYPLFFHELATPEVRLSLLRYLRQTVAHAVTRAIHPVPGPVHLNVPYRDPLPPIADESTSSFSIGVDWSRFFAHNAPAHGAEPLTRAPALASDVHGLIVVGPAQPRDPHSFTAVVGEIARKLGWPVIADGLSPARNYGDRIPNLVTTYDSILRDPSNAERLAPEVVLCLGGWPTSKVLRAWLEGSQAPIWLVSTRVDNRDGLHGSTRQLPISLRALANSLPDGAAGNGYQHLWASFEGPARAMLDHRMDVETELFEPKAAWLLARHLPEETSLFVASSMPARDVEYVWPANDRRVRLFFNRGANGIDGTLSTALGVAHGGAPAVLLTGDLALLHDSNGFLLRPKFRGSLTIVLINNRGGGIFNHLPVAEFEPPFEEFFATPQEADFALIAAAYGSQYYLVRDWAHFTELVTVLPANGIRILEVRTDRRRDAMRRKELFGQIAGMTDENEGG